jgi:hypothetical protein
LKGFEGSKVQRSKGGRRSCEGLGVWRFEVVEDDGVFGGYQIVDSPLWNRAI